MRVAADAFEASEKLLKDFNGQPDEDAARQKSGTDSAADI
jgi:hypothetical protein